MKTTSIYTWYKKVNNLIAKNIEKINVHGFSIGVSFMDIEEGNKSITVHVFNHVKEDCRIIHTCSFRHYLEENVNKKNFENFKNFLENIETLDQSFEDENNDKE